MRDFEFLRDEQGPSHADCLTGDGCFGFNRELNTDSKSDCPRIPGRNGMIFGDVSVDETEGAVLARTVRPGVA